MFKSVNVIQLSELINNPSDGNQDQVLLLDVRTIDEFNFCNIGGKNIPLDEIENRLSEIPLSSTIYCLCHHGVRSSYAANFLIHSGYKDVYNIDGGIDAWSEQVDPKIKKY